ncbi:hypothetical protein [Lysobacter enzymogenes]|uniref:hypothetical protein n=1 Tax=Lysobacter enzymogenes TaxID=69 RepID=UPI001AF78C2B|nr:hypothetical protein [Lysobacter enzymogenes]QQQ01888.1 hypothetical protein JHW41_02550 [Lysobacter enzymogenes]
MGKNQGKQRAGLSDWIGFLTILVVVSAVWCAGWYFIDAYVVSADKNVSNESLRGAFGDKFGAVNALFSGLAFAGVIFAVLLQRRELAMQREELQNNAARFDDQNVVLEQQRFENTFFKLLELHNDITSKLYAPGAEGHGALKVFLRFSVIAKRISLYFAPFRKLIGMKLERFRMGRLSMKQIIRS